MKIKNDNYFGTIIFYKYKNYFGTEEVYIKFSWDDIFYEKKILVGVIQIIKLLHNTC